MCSTYIFKEMKRSRGPGLVLAVFPIGRVFLVPTKVCRIVNMGHFLLLWVLCLVIFSAREERTSMRNA
jgi:hypothetical protein